MMKNDLYQDTVSNSKQDSILRAVDLLIEQIQEQQPKISRPDINLGRMIGKAILWMVPAAVFLILWQIWMPEHDYLSWVVIGYIALVLIGNAKRIVVSLILIYQRYAPERVRASCVFEPTCSNYMLMAIEKFGLISGVHRGIKRLLRCHYPNSGIDYP